MNLPKKVTEFFWCRPTPPPAGRVPPIFGQQAVAVFLHSLPHACHGKSYVPKWHLL